MKCINSLNFVDESIPNDKKELRILFRRSWSSIGSIDLNTWRRKKFHLEQNVLERLNIYLSRLFIIYVMLIKFSSAWMHFDFKVLAYLIRNYLIEYASTSVSASWLDRLTLFP